VRQTDLTRDRKVRVTMHAMHLVTLGLCACLITAIRLHDSVGLLVGLYGPFVAAIGTALGLFVNGNVQVHRANAGAPPAPAAPPTTEVKS
jgi:hypothetical protein